MPSTNTVITSSVHAVSVRFLQNRQSAAAAATNVWEVASTIATAAVNHTFDSFNSSQELGQQWLVAIQLS